MHMHSAFDAPLNRELFIERKIVPGSLAQEDADLVQRLIRLTVGKRQYRFHEALRIGEQRLRHPAHQLDHIDHPGGNGAVRHALILRRLRILCDRQAGLGLDRAKPHGAVGAGPGQDHADGSLCLVFCQGMEEIIDGQGNPLL